MGTSTGIFYERDREKAFPVECLRFIVHGYCSSNLLECTPSHIRIYWLHSPLFNLNAAKKGKAVSILTFLQLMDTA